MTEHLQERFCSLMTKSQRQQQQQKTLVLTPPSVHTPTVSMPDTWMGGQIDRQSQCPNTSQLQCRLQPTFRAFLAILEYSADSKAMISQQLSGALQALLLPSTPKRACLCKAAGLEVPGRATFSLGDHSGFLGFSPQLVAALKCSFL